MLAEPQVGQWCDAKATSASRAKSSIASERYRDQMRGSRTCAPRRVRRLCRLWVAFSARQSARWSGKKKFISAGHSVPGVFWNTMRTPSSTSSCPVRVMSSVGAIRPTVPVEGAGPSPMPNVPLAPLASATPP